MKYELTEKTVVEINENSNLGRYAFFEPIYNEFSEEEILTTHYFLNNENRDYAIAGYYPYNSDALKLIHFYIFSNRQNVLGVFVGQSEKEAIEILEHSGFQKQELKGVFAGYSKDRYRCLVYTKNNVWLILKFDGMDTAINNIFLNLYDPSTPIVSEAE